MPLPGLNRAQLPGHPPKRQPPNKPAWPPPPRIATALRTTKGNSARLLLGGQSESLLLYNKLSRRADAIAAKINQALYYGCNKLTSPVHTMR